MAYLQTPQVAFLGVCDRHSRIRNVDPRFAGINLIGLRREVIGRFYPLSLDSLQIVFAVYEATMTQNVRISCSSTKYGELAWWNLDLKVHPEGYEPSDAISEGVILIPTSPSWSLFVLPFPKPQQRLILEPERLDFFLLNDRDEKIPIGSLDFFYAPTPPLTEERILAIRSDPNATKIATLEVSCQKCNKSIRIYTSLRKADIPADGGVWYQDLPDQFICNCGSTVINLQMLRESFHAALGEKILSNEQELTMTRLYEISTLDTIVDRFERLLDRNPDENEVQSFLEDNTIVFQAFGPWKIIKKAPILNKYNSDFAILSKSGLLFLVEIEKPGKKILKQDGDRTQDFNHPFDQVQNWLHVISEHRIACLDAMGLKNDQVNAIRGLVIIGRDDKYDREHLRKLKSADFGHILFYTYDDLLEGLHTLIREMRKI